MHSSTSSSETLERRARNGAWALIALALALGAALELVTRYVVPIVSTLEGQVQREYRNALSAGDGRGKTVLLAGNSLLGHGVDAELLQRLLGEEVELKRLVVNSTVFYDWYYGARRLHADGARFDVFVVLLAPGHLVATVVAGDYFANHLMLAEDLPEVARAVHATGDQVAGMALARLSEFWGNREGLRNWILQTTIPGMPRLAGALSTFPSSTLEPERVYRTAAERLTRLRSVIVASGAGLVVVIPPSLGGEDLVAAVEEAGKSAGVTVLVPIRPGTLEEDSFSDGYHLSEAGARVFTERLAIELGSCLEDGKW